LTLEKWGADSGESMTVNGSVVSLRLEYRTGMAPRLPGYGCKCTRTGSRTEGWVVEVCERHR
jgi:hypothetical protein